MNAIEPGVLRLQPELTIYTAAELHGQLLAAFEQHGFVQLDLRDVCEIDSAGMQLLIAARRTARVHGRRLQLCQHSDAVLAAFGLCGLDQDAGTPGESHDA